jgi:hypothetical protein
VCDCVEDFGPCAEHGELVLQLDGGNARTSPELCVAFIRNVEELFGLQFDAQQMGCLVEVEEALGVNHWLGDEDHEDLASGLAWLVADVESMLPADAWVFWEDGCWVWRMKDDCPLGVL